MVPVAPLIAEERPREPSFEPLPSSFTRLAEAVIQISIRIFFIMGTIAMGSAILPLFLHAYLIAPIAISATFLAAGFFFKPIRLTLPVKAPLPRLINLNAPHQPLPPQNFLPLDAPRGLRREGMNCGFNSIVHFMNSEPQVVEWAKAPIDADIEALFTFLRPYGVTEEQFHPFRERMAIEPHPKPPLTTAFFHYFLEVDLSLAQKIEAAFRVQLPLSYFWRSYEDREAGNPASQFLRLAVHGVAPQSVSESCWRQEDAQEIMNPIYEAMPDSIKMRLQRTIRYNTQGMPPLNNNPDGITTYPDSSSAITLDLQKDFQNIQELLNNYCNNEEFRTYKGIDGQNHSYPSTETVRFERAPSSLRLHIKRTARQKGLENWLTSWSESWLKKWYGASCCPPLPGRTVKIQKPIIASNTIDIPLVNGERCRYQLQSFVIHHGDSFDGGHYTAGRIVNGQRYLIDDTQVTLADPIIWEAQLRQAYLLCYLPAPEPAPE